MSPVDQSNDEDTSLKKRKISQKKNKRTNNRLQIRKEQNDEADFSYKSDVNIALKYYGEQNGYEIKF